MDIDDEDGAANNAQDAGGKNDVTSGLACEPIESGLDSKEILNNTSNNMAVENSRICATSQITTADT